eukprot:12969123-Ditylum_brightwellii.AAC.1
MPQNDFPNNTIQDTNGLAFHTLPLALGVSVKFDLAMNSIAVPRKAKQAIGGITRLENEKGEQRAEALKQRKRSNHYE